MSGVLAVMDAEIASAVALAGSDAYQAERLPKLHEARAAVAELVKRAQETVEYFEDDYDMADLRAALARVQGGQS